MLNRISRRIPSIGSLLRIIVSVGLLGAVLYFVDFDEARSVLLGMNLWYILAFIVVTYCDRALMAYKWNPLLVALNVRVPYFALFRMYSAAGLAGMLLPSTIGGDVFRVYSLSRYKVKKSAIITSIVVERMIGFIALLVPIGLALGLAAFLFRDQWLQFRGVVWAFLILLALGALAVWIMQGLGKKPIDNIASRMTKFPLVARLHYIYTLFGEYRKRWRTIGAVFALTVFEQLLPILTVFLMIKAFHIQVSFWELLVIVPISLLVIRLPISLDGIGVHEGINVILFGLVGVSVAEALLLTLATRILLVLCAVPWGLSYIWSKPAPIPAGHQADA